MENTEMMEVTENTEVEVDYDEVYETSGGLGKVILGLGALAAAAVGVVVCKKKKVLDKWAIKRLEKSGHVVYPADEVEVVQIEEDSSEETQE
jgi:hypothetical protein